MRMGEKSVATGQSALAGFGLAAMAAARIACGLRGVARARRGALLVPDAKTTVLAAKRLNTAAGVLAASVLTDSAVEHYRGGFHNKAMITPLVTASLSLAVSIHGNADDEPVAHEVRDAVYFLSGLTGLIGTGFHIYNVGKRTGGFSWQNLFYAAPMGAPAALTLSGMTGFLAERVREARPGTAPTIAGLLAGRLVGLLTSLGLFGTVAEAGLLHFRGSFQHKAMYIPVTVPPVTAALLAAAAIGPRKRNLFWARTWLRLTAIIGVAGAGFHTRGVARQMGGWRNWTQNLLSGPPIPAPPSFTGLALAGLAALGLLEDLAE